MARWSRARRWWDALRQWVRAVASEMLAGDVTSTVGDRPIVGSGPALAARLEEACRASRASGDSTDLWRLLIQLERDPARRATLDPKDLRGLISHPDREVRTLAIRWAGALREPSAPPNEVGS